MPFGSSSQTVITWQFGAVSQEENSVSLCYDSALVFGGTSGDGQCDWPGRLSCSLMSQANAAHSSPRAACCSVYKSHFVSEGLDMH